MAVHVSNDNVVSSDTDNGQRVGLPFAALKTIFEYIENPIARIKLVRQLTDLDLRASKEICDFIRLVLEAEKQN